MVILLGVLVFAAFVILDLIMERQSLAKLYAEGEPLHDALESAEPDLVAGFNLPQALIYHRGHTWVHWVSPELAYVGLDDFARRLIGRRAQLALPHIGTQVSQGEGAIRVGWKGNEARLLSPLSGEVVAVNPRLKRDPDLFFDENYGRGWIFKVKSPSLYSEISNLLDGSLARRWMEDTRERFQHRLMLVAGSVIQDGGESIEDIASGLESEEWRVLVGEFLLPRAR